MALGLNNLFLDLTGIYIIFSDILYNLFLFNLSNWPFGMFGMRIWNDGFIKQWLFQKLVGCQGILFTGV